MRSMLPPRWAIDSTMCSIDGPDDTVRSVRAHSAIIARPAKHSRCRDPRPGDARCVYVARRPTFSTRAFPLLPPRPRYLLRGPDSAHSAIIQPAAHPPGRGEGRPPLFGRATRNDDIYTLAVQPGAHTRTGEVLLRATTHAAGCTRAREEEREKETQYNSLHHCVPRFPPATTTFPSSLPRLPHHA